MDKIKETWEFLEQFDLIMIQETWLEKANKARVIEKYSNKYCWTTTAADRTNVNGRASGGQLVGIHKRMNESWRKDEWNFKLILKILIKEKNKKGCILGV